MLLEISELRLTAFFGYLDELRDYYEALPIVYTLSLAATGIKFKTRGGFGVC